MVRLDPKKARLFEANTRACLKNIEALYKARNWRGLAAPLTKDTVVYLAKSRRTIVGEKRIIDFMRQLKARGLEDLKFNIEKLTLRPVHYLVATESGYSQYDMVADIFGKVVFSFRGKSGKPDPMEVGFIMEKPHVTICMVEPRTIYLDF